MRIVDRDRFLYLKKRKLIYCSSCEHLDDLRIGLHLSKKMLKAPEKIGKFAAIEKGNWLRVNSELQELERLQFYLALTREKIRLPDNIFGLIHSRSIFTRIGLDSIQSSFYVTMGFGRNRPLPLVLELFPKISLMIDLNTAVAGLLLFEMDRDYLAANQNLEDLFPLLFKF